MKKDKQYHLIAGILFSTLALFISNDVITTVIGLFIISIGKELYDFIYNKVTKSNKRKVELLDILYTFMGGLIPVITYILLIK